MVYGEVYCAAICHSSNASRITRVRHVNVLLSDKSYICSAPCCLCIILPGDHIFVLPTVAQQFLPAIRPQQKLVEDEEHILESLLIIALFEVFVLLELLYEVIFAKLGHFCASMTIKDCHE